MADFIIREATSSDLPAILVLYRQFNPDSPWELPLDKAKEIWQRMFRYPNYRVYLAEGAEGLLGVFTLLIMDNLGHGGAPVGIAENVIVNVKYRGRGIGKQMMRLALERCREAGCYKLMLSSNLTRPEAHRFYESLGFEKHGFSFVVDS